MNINEKMKEVPFGNSAFQIIHFTAKHETPERSYRSILLQLDSKNKEVMKKFGYVINENKFYNQVNKYL